MRFPFFNTNDKVETRSPIKTPATANKLSATQRIPLPALVNPRQTIPAATPVPPAPKVVGPTVPLKISTISPQIPSQVYSAAGQSLVATAVANIPVKVILPQLATGKVSIKLNELLSYFPSGMLRSPLPPYPETQAVVLPLEEIIPAIPTDMLNTNPESEVSVDDPELTKLPSLIDDEMVAAQRKQRNNPVSLADTQPLRRVGAGDDPFRGIKNEPKPASAPHVAVQPPAPAKEPLAIVVPPRPRNDLPESIVISLKALVGVLPENVLSCPRAEAETKAESQDPIRLPTEAIIPQLRTGSARLPVSVIVSLLPVNLLADPMPTLDGLMAPLPLAEVIAQLPASVFTEHHCEATDLDTGSDLNIPDPFQEKNAPRKPEPEPEPLALDSDVLADEGFAIFSEKSAPAPVASTLETVQPISLVRAAPIEPPAPVREPEPVAQAPVEPVAVAAPEPVAEVAPAPVVEAVPPVVKTPQPEVIAPAAEVALAPVVEEVAPPVESPQPEAVASVAEAAPEPIPVVVPEPVAAIEPTPAPVLEPEYADADLADDDEAALLPSAPTAAAPTLVDDRKLLVDLNRCTVEDLMTIPGVGRALAQRIIEFRSVRGHFESIEELRQVPGIGRKTFRALAGVQPRALNRLLGAEHDGELTLQEIVRLTGNLPGIQGCMLALSDGLFLTGHLPAHLDQNTISVFAPQLFKKVGRYARELKVGQIRRFTIFTDNQPLSIFKAGDVYVIIVHDTQRYSKALLRRCERISEEIARLSSQRVTV